MAVTSAVHAIRLGEFELNDLLDASAYVEIAEQQNHVYLDSRGVLYSFAVSDAAGWPTATVGAPGYVFSAWAIDAPDGIDQVLVTWRAQNTTLRLFDLTAGGGAVAVQAFGGTETTYQASYSLPATGVRLFALYAAGVAPGLIRAVTMTFAASTLP